MAASPADAKNYAYLVFVDSRNNHNKYYEIIENNDGSLDCNYGRVQGSKMHHHYSPYEKDFYSLKASKEGKGYTDVTALHSEKTVSQGKVDELSFKPVEDEVVQQALDRMIEASRMFVSQNYTVTAKEITSKMIDEAQLDLKHLSDIASRKDTGCNLYDFNRTLESLFTDIPRAMTRVEDYMAKTSDDFDKIIQRESDMLSNLKGAITVIQPPANDKGRDQTVLEARGLTMRQVSYKEEDQIRDHLGKDYSGNVERRYVRAFAVENLRTRKNYEEYKKEHHISPKGVRLFYHGSKTENWYSIIQQGMSLNPDARVTGKMFGQGLYFAPECRKALNYMDTRGSRWNNGTAETGYTAVYSVAIGKAYQPDRVLGSNFYKKDLPAGCNSVFASKKNPSLNLLNDEYIVYDEKACTIKYLMEMTSHYVPELDFTIDRKAMRDAFIGKTSSFEKQSPTTLKATVPTDSLSESAKKSFNDIEFEEGTILSFCMNINSGKVESIKDDESKELISYFTKDDIDFLSRELKKNFAESEYDWKQLMNIAQKLGFGQKVNPLGSKVPIGDFVEKESKKKSDKERE